MIKLSIIIPVYNVEKYIERCLHSCIKQDLPQDEYEVIVVNDGSPDRSPMIAEQIAKEYSNIKIIHRENGGLSAARNTGVSVALGEYVWFVDSDDWIEENCLKRLTDTLYNDNLDALVINGVRVINGEHRKNPPRAFTDRILTGTEFLKETVVNCAAVITVYKREILLNNNLHFMEGIYHEDAEFTPRAYYFINRIGIKNYHLYYNYLNPASITQTPNPKKGFDLIKVARSLDKFKKSLPNNLSVCYDKYISAAVNQSLNNALQMKGEILNTYINEMNENKFLFKSMIGLSNVFLKVEGLLLWCFPRKCVSIYRFIKSIKK